MFDTTMALIALGMISFVLGWGVASILMALIDAGRLAWRRIRH